MRMGLRRVHSMNKNTIAQLRAMRAARAARCDALHAQDSAYTPAESDPDVMLLDMLIDALELVPRCRAHGWNDTADTLERNATAIWHKASARSEW